MAEVAGKRRRHGAAVVEMAIMLPLLLVLTFGLVEYGWLLLKVQQVNGAARYGARIAILPDASTLSVTSAISQELSRAGINGGYTVTFTPSDVATPQGGEQLRVEIAVQYHGNIDLGMPLVPVPGSFHVSVSMAKESP